MHNKRKIYNKVSINAYEKKPFDKVFHKNGKENYNLPLIKKDFYSFQDY